MQRRSNAVSGWVRFPVNDPAWRNSEEGGMVVKLVVCDNREFDAQFGMCCGADVYDVISEVLIGDDRRPKPKPQATYASVEEVQAEQQARDEWERYHFPSVGGEGDLQYLSRAYLATMVLGTTGWSGWHDGEERYWTCQVTDLTPEGQALYQQLAALYPGCDLHLLTYLDT